MLTLHDNSILALQNKGKLHLLKKKIEETQGLRASGRFDKVHSLAVQMIQESQQEVGGEVFV